MLESSLSRSPLFVHFFDGEELGEKCKLRYDLNVIFGTLDAVFSTDESTYDLFLFSSQLPVSASFNKSEFGP